MKLKLLAGLVAFVSSTVLFADRFGINEPDGLPAGAFTAYWVILGLVAAYFCYRSVFHDEPFEVLAVALVSALLGIGFGMLNFARQVFTK